MGQLYFKILHITFKLLIQIHVFKVHVLSVSRHGRPLILKTPRPHSVVSYLFLEQVIPQHRQLLHGLEE